MAESAEKKAEREHVTASSGDLVEAQIAKLRDAFPEVVVEGKIDFEKLRVMLGAAAESGPGRFLFTWAGRDDAVSLLLTPGRATLVPCPEESVNFESTGNAFIEGDNLEVLKLLFKPYFGRVKLIYIDPPYNTGQDFIYPDNYADPLKRYLEVTGQADAAGNLLTSNPETSGRYHSAWLSMMYPRLFLARQLLREDGAILVSIDDHEMHHLRIVMNEIFGEENFISSFVSINEGNIDNQSRIKQNHEYILMYGRDGDLFTAPPVIDPNIPNTSKLYTEYVENTLVKNGPANPVTPIVLPAGFPASFEEGKVDPKDNFWPKLSGSVRVEHFKTQNEVTVSSGWSARELFERFIGGKFQPVPDTKGQESVFYLSDTGAIMVKKRRSDTQSHVLSVLRGMGTVQEESAHLAELGIDFSYPKPTRLLKYLLQIGAASKDAIVLDFFAGSGGIAEAVLQLNREDNGSRRFILVQLPQKSETTAFASIAEIGKERVRRVLAEFARTEKRQLNLDSPPAEDLGFKVFKLAPPNIQQWGNEEADPEAYIQKLSLFNDPLVPGWKPENVIWEVALREGFSLNTRFTAKDLPNGNKVYTVDDPDTGQKFLICLDEQIRSDFSRQCELTLDTLLVCRDVALDDSAAANLALQCRLKTI